MPRVNKVETCMFCGCTPCECNKPAPKERKAPVKPTPMEPSLKPGFSVPESAPVPTRKPGPFAGFKSPTEQLAEQAEAKPKTETEQLAGAVHVLLQAGILCKEDRHKYGRMLTTTRDPALDARVNQWKAARRG